ncbi:mucin-2-like isoform X2 [Episyrphus balteatus]|uniref:mucin-2-like isoform X2 n=1 Tax=Episyrphus balteatus TaxID=286459 RepID=UPI002485197A|nr:mucin-2-like isoform X2 [Episyrphus balteatus]
MNNPNVFGNKIWIAAVVFCVGITISQFPVFAAPQNNEKNETPFPLELQPPLVDNLQDAIDSYGNPITYSQPIETPDGRKVITAQGVQFEIPNYASGITEIKKPIQNLLPPFVDPNAVQQQNDAFYSQGTDYSATQQEYTLPDWLADFNDPDVGPGVPYTPSSDENSLKILSWDLVPPKESDPQAQETNFGINQHNTFPLKLTTNQGFKINGGAQTTFSLPIITTTTTTRPTTTSKKTTARTTLTTTTTTTTPSPATTTTEVISSSNSISDEVFALPGGNSEVLPSWLEGFDDPELSIAVPFEVPEDNKEYNHTLSSNLLPPLEPFEDLKILSVSGFPPSQVHSVVKSTSTALPNTTPLSIRTTSVRPPSSTFKPFQFQFVTNRPITLTQKPIFNTSPKTTNKPMTNFSAITENPNTIRIPQLTLKSSAQPTGFTPSSFVATQPTVKPTVQPVFSPYFHSRIGQNGFTSYSKITSTMATPTPSWLTGSVKSGQGVPFSLPEKKESQQSFNGILPTTNHVAEQTVDGSIVPTNQAFIFTSTPIPEPSRLFTPPAVVLPDKDVNSNIDGNLQLQTIPINSYNFAEPTEQTTKPTSKFTFNKSDQGKVISNSVFQPVQLSTRTDPPISQPTPIGFTSSTLVPNLSPQSATTGTVFGGKYTGGFGGAPGFLGGQSRPGYAVQPDGSIRDPDHTVRPLGQVAAPSVNLQSRFDIPRVSNSQTTTTATGPKRVYTGSFGGPPGVLVPFDNVSVA